MQLPVTLQNGNEVNREMLPPQAASSVCVSTKHNGLITIALVLDLREIRLEMVVVVVMVLVRHGITIH